jgi:16S rRNA (uracil1498-N3)-methyltransferase
VTLRVPLDELAQGERELDAQAARYVARVHRLAPGDRFVAFDPQRRLEAEARVVTVERRVRVELGPPRAATAVAERTLMVVQALAKGTKIDAIVRDATELGATHVVVVAAERSVKRGVHIGRLERVALDAARQSGRGDVPRIEAADLPEALGGALGRRIVLDPSGAVALGAVLAGSGADEALSLLIGPEGGFSAEERGLALARGFVAARLGRFVLRTETACAAALGAVAALG